jgi:peptidoglycan/xylan/chitin deacetylase (PgdA/CDA1 family)
MLDVLVLCYHAVSDRWSAPLSVTSDALDRQLATLVARGYRGRRFTEAVTERPQHPTVVVTFDDGYRSVLERAKPILDRHGLPGTLFVPTDWPDDPRPMRWPGIDTWLDGPFEQELAQLRWEELRGLAGAGWEIGSHTCSHPHLTKLSDTELAHELQSSKRQIESHLQTPCTSIAYPYGDVDNHVETAADDAGYLAGAALPRVMHRSAVLRWPRTGIYHRDTPSRFRTKVSPTVRLLRASAPARHLDAMRLRTTAKRGA